MSIVWNLQFDSAMYSTVQWQGHGSWKSRISGSTILYDFSPLEMWNMHISCQKTAGRLMPLLQLPCPCHYTAQVMHLDMYLISSHGSCFLHTIM